MEIKLGDVVRDRNGREGAITNIGIATSKTDVAGELGVDAKEYVLLMDFYKVGVNINVEFFIIANRIQSRSN